MHEGQGLSPSSLPGLSGPQPLHFPVRGLSIRPSHWGSSSALWEYQLCTGALAFLRVGSVPYILLRFLAQPGAPRSFWPHLSSFTSILQMPPACPKHATRQGSHSFALPFSLPEAPSPFSTRLHPSCASGAVVGPLRQAVFSKPRSPEPKGTVSAHAPSSRLALQRPISLCLSGHGPRGLKARCAFSTRHP